MAQIELYYKNLDEKLSTNVREVFRSLEELNTYNKCPITNYIADAFSL